MKTIAKQNSPKYIGYFNPKDSPLSISLGGSGTEILGRNPVVNSNGLLVAQHDVLDQLVSQGLLSRIPAESAEFKNWDQKVAQRNSGNVVTQDGPRRSARQQKEEEPDTIVSSSRSLPDVEPTDDLPVGAKKDGSAILYDGKRFTSRPSLNAYIANQSR